MSGGHNDEKRRQAMREGLPFFRSFDTSTSAPGEAGTCRRCGCHLSRWRMMREQLCAPCIGGDWR